MTQIVTLHAGKLKSVPDDSQPLSTKYFRVEVPHEYVELCSIADPKEDWVRKGYTSHDPLLMTYQLAEFIRREMVDLFGAVPPMDIDRVSITTTGAGAEWLCERLGWTNTVRFKLDLFWRDDLRGDVDTIDEDAVIFVHDRHVSLKFQTEEAATLIEIKFGEYRVTADVRSNVDDLDNPPKPKRKVVPA